MYDYIKEHYPVTPVEGGRVRCEYTHKEGTITKESLEHTHYVMVNFDGSKYRVPCHPTSLIYLANESLR